MQIPGASVYTNEVWVFRINESETEEMIANTIANFEGT